MSPRRCSIVLVLSAVLVATHRGWSQAPAKAEINPGLPAVFTDWPMFRGNASRTAQGDGGSPLLEARWRYPTWQDEITRQWLAQAVKYQEERNSPVLPGFFPIAVTVETGKGPVALLVYRSHWGIHTRNIGRDGKLIWDAASNWSIDRIIEDPDKKIETENWQWPMLYLNTHPNLLYENSTVGTLSSDGKYVFLVEDLQLPPHPQSNPMQQLTRGQTPSFGKFHDALHRSELHAYLLETGKFKWYLGGREEDKGELKDCYFLAAPLPLGGKLFVVIDKQSKLRLVCLDPPKKENESPTLDWSQPLVDVRGKMLTDLGRRMQAVHLAFGEGILVCPTNAGRIVGVEVASHKIVWTHTYRDEPAPADPNPAKAPPLQGKPKTINLNPEWKTSAPVVYDGKVVFTAPDSPLVHCLNLRTGELVWRHGRGDDLYLAGVFKDKVVLVGKSTCRALSLADGKPLWKLETGLPSGQGAASDNVYYLPLKSGAQSREPEVCAIDIHKGVILARTRSRRREVPGNLIFFNGFVISQTVDRITAYPQLAAKLLEIDMEK
jgi:hypothetical protein